MKALGRILWLWRGRAPLLLAGVGISLAAIACSVALMAVAGASVAALLTGTALAAGLLLQVTGPGRVLLRYAERMVTHNATFRAIADLRVWFFRGLALRAAGGLGFRQAGDLLSRLVGDVEALDGIYLRILVPLAGALILVTVAAVAAARVSPWAGVAVGVLMAASAFAMPALAARATARAGADLSVAASGLRVAALDTLTGLREVRAFSAEGRMEARVAGCAGLLERAQHTLASRVALANAGALLCGQASLLAILLAAGASPLLAVAGAFLVTAAFEPAGVLPRAGVVAATAAAAAARVLDIAADAPAPAEPEAPKAIAAHPGLRFAGVHFAWGEGQPTVLSGLTLEVPAGSRVAVLGPSGAGKSTLAALALKIAHPQSGRIFLGGTDLAELSSADVRQAIAYLGQTTHLFSDSIRANLLLGRPRATDRDLWDALDRAAIGDMVRALPEQLDTWLGEGGANLSGGQGRRVALARTLLQRAPVLILDEPCAGLDADTERAFLTTLFAQTSGQTVVLIAHRLTGAERLDRIWRLSSGHAVAAAA